METNSTQLDFRTYRGWGMKSLAFALAAGMATTAFSAEWKISAGDVAALTNAFTQAQEGDVVTLAKGDYDLSSVFMSTTKSSSSSSTAVITNRLAVTKKNLTLRGESGATRDEVVLDGGGCRLVYINSSSQSGFALTNLTLRNFGAGYNLDVGGVVSYRGGAIYATSTCKVGDCVVRDCKAGYAALYGTGIVCTDTLLTNCVGSSYSGAATYGTYANCRFVGNSCETSNGGAAASISASNCWFEANTAKKGGGAVYGGQIVNASSTTPAPCVYEDCVFTNNTAQATEYKYGGGAYCAGRYNEAKKKAVGDIFRRCRFVGNAALSGGAVFAGTADTPAKTDKIVPVTFEDCTFEANKAQMFGGAAFEYNYYYTSADAACERGLLFSNCTFRANAVPDGDSGATQSESSGFAKIAGGGATYGAKAVGSTFVGNHALYFGGAAIGGIFEGCTFTSNWTEAVGSNYGGGVGYRVESASNCTFVANGANMAKMSGAILLNARTIRNSTFRDNICTNQGWGLVTSALPGLEIYDCVFTNSPNNRGNATIYNTCSTARAKLVRCSFYDNLNAKYDEASGDGKINGWAARDCDAEDCVFTDGALDSGDRLGCSATRCVFEGIAPLRVSLFDATDAAPISLTNCLIKGCTAPDGCHFFRACQFVNCTIVDNVFAKSGFSLASSMLNCLLYGNKKSDGTASDLFHRIDDDSKLTIRGCVYGVNGQASDATSFEDLGGSLALGGTKPGFNAGRCPGYPYYSLRRSSPAHGRGVDAALFAGATDLAGNARVHTNADGTYAIDVGCYECWLPSTGLMLIIR